MDFQTILLACAGLYIAGIVKGATGLGYASCALPLLAASLGIKNAMVLVLWPTLATNVAVALTSGHLLETVRRFSWLYASMVPGIAIGVHVLVWLDPSACVLALGLVMAAYATFSLLRPNLVLAQELETPLQIPVGLLNGIVTGLTGSQVMPLLPYIMSLKLDPDRSVQAVNLAVTLACVILAVALLVTRVVTWPLLLASLVATVPALAGTWLGTRCRRALPPEAFRRIAFVVLLVMGVGLMLRA